jgi:hypothetical protein
MNFESVFLAALPLVLTATDSAQNDAVDSAADKIIAAVHDSETQIDDVLVKAAVAKLRRMFDRIETQI